MRNVFLFAASFLLLPFLGLASEAVIIGADTVWSPDLIAAPPDALDSTDAPEQNLIKRALISHADTVWNSNLEQGELGIPPEPSPEPTPTPSPEPPDWSFAVITDLHIGRGYPDYGDAGYESEASGEDYYLTERLKNVVKWITDNKDNVDCRGSKCSIKFLAVLGDFADSAEKSEFLKAKSILDKLNEYDIPYIPVFGNHDVWPYTEKDEAPASIGEKYFDDIFWNENATNTNLLKERLNIQLDPANPNYKNLAFSYKGMNFVGLDFNSREKSGIGFGVKGEANIFPETENWLREHLNEYQGKEPVILLSHEPLAKPYSRTIYEIIKIPRPEGNFDLEEIRKIERIMEDYENASEGKQVLANFGGHIHGFEKFGKEITKEFLGIELGKDLFFDANLDYPTSSTIPVITTEALMVSGNEQDISNKGVIRLVKVNGNNNEIDYSTTEGKFPALNPYISWAYKFLEDSSNPCVFFKSHPFTHRDISSYRWQFGDGITKDGAIIPFHCFPQPGIYNVTSTLTDAATGIEEEITRKIEIKEGLISKIIKIKNELLGSAEIISQNIGEDLLGFGKYLIEGTDNLLLIVKHSPAMPVGEITVDFDTAKGDIDLSQMIFDTSTTTKKSILYMPNWPEEIGKNKIILVPK